MCDSGTDLSAGLAEEYGISVVPIVVTLGDHRVPDSPTAREEFWAYIEQGFKPLTSQPPAGDFVRAFQEIVDAGDDALCITITAEHSGTFNSARLGAMDFGNRVTVCDSRFASRGAGLQVELAAKMAREGHTVEEILPALQDLRERTLARLQLESLEYIRRGGRLDRILPTIDRVARALNVKPLLTMTDGELKLVGVSRSSKKGMIRIVEEIARLDSVERIIILHARTEDAAMDMRTRLSEALGRPEEDIEVDEIGVSLASHGGPGLLLLFAVCTHAPESLMDRVRQRLDI